MNNHRLYGLFGDLLELSNFPKEMTERDLNNRISGIHKCATELSQCENEEVQKVGLQVMLDRNQVTHETRKLIRALLNSK